MEDFYDRFFVPILGMINPDLGMFKLSPYTPYARSQLWRDSLNRANRSGAQQDFHATTARLR